MTTGKIKFALLIFLFFIAIMPSMAQTNPENDYTPKFHDGQTMGKVRTEMEQLLKDVDITDRNNAYRFTPESITVYEEKIEYTDKGLKRVILFSDLLDHPIKSQQYNRGKNAFYVIWIQKLGLFFYLKGSPERQKELSMKLADDLYYIQTQFNKIDYNAQLKLFEPIAAQYRALKVKPPMSEDQRKLIVQANVLNQNHLFEQAIDMYQQAIVLDQTAYPAAYSNLALIAAQVHEYHLAIFYMKEYMMLVPDASDIRGCQDKIYEWEILMKN